MNHSGEGVFHVISPNAKLLNMSYQGNEQSTLFVGFNFLTEEVNEKVVYNYFVEQHDHEGNFIGGEKYLVTRDDRSLFTAYAGNDEQVLDGQPISLQAPSIGEAATYNWYIEIGELIYSGTDTTFVPTENTIYTLEVIAHSDGYKDYDEKSVTVKEFYIGSVFPNPLSNQTNLNIKYEVSTANSAYLLVNNTSTNVSNHYILNIQNTSLVINLIGYTSGVYSVSLVVDGIYRDYKTFTI